MKAQTLTPEVKQANKLARQEAAKQAKENARIEAEKNQKPVKKITITIEWRKSRTWGSNPKCEAQIHFKDGSWGSSPVYTCSGCGYDKESTVIADVFNDYLKYKLWQLTPEQLKGGNGSLDPGKAPYGIHLYSDNRPHFGGGIGTSCYPAIAKYIGGEFENVASGKTFDVFTYTDNS